EITLSPYSAADQFASPDTKPLTLEDVLGIEPPPPPVEVPVIQPFITEIYNRGRGNYNAFNPATIHPFPSPKPFKPGTLPTPSRPAVPVNPGAGNPGAANPGANAPLPMPMPPMPMPPVVEQPAPGGDQ